MLFSNYLIVKLKSHRPIGSKRRVVFVLIFCMTTLTVALAQEKPEPVLVDQFSKIGCDNYLAHIDNFYQSYLEKDSASHGFVIISGDNRYLNKKLAYELTWDGAMEQRAYNPSRVTKIRGKESGDLDVQFWYIPAGLDIPRFQTTTWNFTFPANTKPFILHSDMEQICSTPTFAKVYKEYLDTNPDAHGNVVIFANSKRAYRKGLNEAKKTLNNIPMSRIRFFLSHIDDSYPYAEYWLVPKKD